MSQNDNFDTATVVLERIGKIYKCKTDKDLKDVLQLQSSSNLSTWRDRGGVTNSLYQACIRLSKRDGIDLLWLLTGEAANGDKQVQEVQLIKKEKLTARQRLIIENLIDELERLNEA
jgi:hypothetical protein